MQNEVAYISEKIRDLRKAKNIKQAELDTAASLPRSSISKIELGKREATADELVRIARSLGVTLDTLVSGENAFVYLEEIKVIEALREIPFEDYQRILRTLEAQVYFAAKDADGPLKQHLHDLVKALTRLSQADRRPRSHVSNIKRIRR
jgi:transcriptional regulator with XRE-family HTH domain